MNAHIKNAVEGFVLGLMSGWYWLTGHDIGWYATLATIIYILMQAFVLARDKIFYRAPEAGE